MFEKVDIHSLYFNPFDKVGKDWLLISATKNGKTNTMTASWGTLGHLWNKNVAIIFIRPQRYTKEFVDESETFTLSFFDDKHKELSYLGTKSGKDEDKISNVNFHIEMVDGNPTIKEAKEETGLKNVTPITENILGLDVLNVNGHVKKGKYISSHLHLSIAYLLEANEEDELIINEEETNGVKWIPIDELHIHCTEDHIVKTVYSKFNKKIKELNL